MKNMIALIRSLLAPLLSLILLIMASGLFNTFIAIRLEIEGFDPEDIGVVTAALYAGILLGSLKIDRWIQRVGHTRAMLTFALSSSAIALIQMIAVNLWYWSILRLITGICTAGIFISIESWLLMQSNLNRGAILSLYLGVFYGALSLGQFLINLSDPAGNVPFCITAFLCTLAMVPLLLQKTGAPKIEQSVRLSFVQLFRISPLGFLGGVISGMLLAAVYGLVPVYAKEIGLSVSQIGNLMAMIIFGGLSLQWPIGRMADKGKRRILLSMASFLSALLGFTIALLNPQSMLLLLLLGWAFGGFSFTLYPLSMAYTCERVQEGQIIAATGGFVLSYGIGAIAGPLLAPIAMDLFGAPGLFYFLALISLCLGLAGLFDFAKKPAED